MTPKRKRGRPSGGLYTIQKHIFLDKTTAEQLERLSRAEGLTESAYVRRLIQQTAKGREQ